MSLVELLSPAGTYECAIAAFNAGADAVYLAGNMFGARAYAKNLSAEEIIEALHYAHIYQKKISNCRNHPIFLVISRLCFQDYLMKIKLSN